MLSTTLQQQRKKKLQQLKQKVSSPNIFVIATHHARIICFFNKLRKLAGSNTEEKLAVRNVAVLKFTYIPGQSSSTVIVELVYEGIQNKGYNNEWTMSQNKFYIFELTMDTSTHIFPGYTETPVILYMVRHGLGLHNKKSNLLKLELNLLKWITSDPLLINDEGIEHAATAIKKDIDQYTEYEGLYLVSSPLRRCIETMALLVLEWKKQLSPSVPQEAVIYILPCLHELPAKDKNSDGLCDNDNNALQPNSKRWLHPENTSICISNTDSCRTLSDVFKKQFVGMKHGDILKKLQSQSQSINIDWTIYEHNIKGDCKRQVFSEFLKILANNLGITFNPFNPYM